MVTISCDHSADSFSVLCQINTVFYLHKVTGNNLLYESLYDVKLSFKLTEFSLDDCNCVSPYVFGWVDVLGFEILDCYITSSFHGTVLQLSRLSNRSIMLIEIKIFVTDAIVE